MKTILFFLISGMCLYALLILVLFFMQRSLLYFPSNERPDLSQYPAIGLEEVTLKTEDGLELTAWFIRPDPTRDGRTFLLFHGNAGHIGHRERRAHPQVPVLLGHDYPRSPGRGPPTRQDSLIALG